MIPIYEWKWLEENGERYLFVKVSRTPTLEDWLRFYREALADFMGGNLKALYDLRLSENRLNYNQGMAHGL